MADEQAKTIVHVITECMKKGVATIQPTEQAENEWVETIVSGAKGRRAFLEACTPGYYNYEVNANALPRSMTFTQRTHGLRSAAG